MSKPGKRHGVICPGGSGILSSETLRRRKGGVCSNHTGIIVGRDSCTVCGPDVLLLEHAKRLEGVNEKYGRSPLLLWVEGQSPHDWWGKVRRRVRAQLRFGSQGAGACTQKRGMSPCTSAARSRLFLQNTSN